MATPGLAWLLLVISVAGIIRGFTGFGTALIFAPVANIFLEPKQVVTVIALTGVASNAVVLPRAWGQASRREVGLLVAAALLTVPVGIGLLDLLDRTAVRWVVTGVAGGMLAALLAGWRYARPVPVPMLLPIGAAAGVIGGMTGLTGPVVILFYLAGQALVQAVRANTILFLAALDAVILVNLGIKGDITPGLLLLAGIVSIPYAVTTTIGQALFDPRHERLYRRAAYAVIGLAVVSGLPVWDNGG